MPPRSRRHVMFNPVFITLGYCGLILFYCFVLCWQGQAVVTIDGSRRMRVTVYMLTRVVEMRKDTKLDHPHEEVHICSAVWDMM